MLSLSMLPLALLSTMLPSAAHAARVSPLDIPNPRPRGSWVSDQADVLTDAQQAAIDQRVDALQAELGAEIAVVTASELDRQPKAFATELFNQWGVGDETANNGVLVLLAVDARRVEIETGYGVEGILTDGWLGRMMDDSMVPAFRAGELGAGLVAGVEAIDGRLRAHPEETRLGTGGAVSGPARETANDKAAAAVLGLVAAGSVGGPLALAGGVMLYQRRRRQCPVCREKMTLLSEEADDAHLDEGQRKEEALGSVDYEVLVCDQHQQVRVIPRGKWMAGYHRCPDCRYRTSKRKTNTLVHATYVSGGRVEVIEDCKHCGRHHRFVYTTPRKTPPSSSSSSGGGGFSGGGGGGSFGGGRSGGGGSGRSW